MTPSPTAPTVVNFDTLPDGASGVELSDYLASFGITTGGVTSGVTLQTQTNRPGWAFEASSAPSYLLWYGRNDVWQTFTLNFSAPLSRLSFTRCTELPVNGGTAFPAWSATVYQGATVVGTAGESAYSIWSPNTSPAQTYNFTGTGITSITFSANTWNFAGVGSPAIDDIVVTPVAPVAPTITIQPVSTTASLGGSAKFSVGISGTPLLTYQWALNSTNLVGAIHATLIITNLSQVNIGAYTVTVSNPAGSVTSQAATLAAVDIKMFAGVIVDGPLGSHYLIQATSNLLSGWTTLTNVVLAVQPYIFIDYSSPANPRQFYRAVPQ
jgi:hypothetical protein